MAINEAAVRGRQKQYEDTVIDFVKNQKGHFLAVTDDQAFLSVLRTVLTKDLALTSPDLLNWIPEPSQLLKEFRKADEASPNIVVFMERMIHGQDLTFLVRQLKLAYPKVYIVVVTVEIEQARLMYLHEVGADNFITKPVSANTIIEKLAFTRKPQSKHGQVLDLAKGLLARGDAEKAREVARQVLELKPGSAAGYIVLGDAERLLGNTQAAKEAYIAASDNADLYLEPLHKLAELAQETGDTEGCYEYLEKLDRLSPFNSERKLNMGELLLKKGDMAGAEELFNAAVAQVVKDAMTLIGNVAERIAAAYGDRNPEQAVMFLRKALDAKGKNLTRDDVKLFNKLGIALRQQGKWEEAVEEYRKALHVAPRDENLYYNIGMAYAEGRQFRNARMSMAEAMKLNPDIVRTSAGIAFNIGFVYMQSDAREQARRCFEVALELNPGMEQAQRALLKLGL